MAASIDDAVAFSENVSEEPQSHLLTLQVTDDQESAMEAFFEINSWQLIKGKTYNLDVHSYKLI